MSIEKSAFNGGNAGVQSGIRLISQCPLMSKTVQKQTLAISDFVLYWLIIHTVRAVWRELSVEDVLRR